MHLAARGARARPAIPTGDVRLFVVPTDAAGLTVERQDTFNHEPQFHVDVRRRGGRRRRRAPARRDRRPGRIDWLVDRATVGLCAMAAGVSDAGMRITAGYVAERKQFDRPIGTFQAVATAWPTATSTTRRSASRMLQAATPARPPAPSASTKEVAVAKYWASYGGSRVGHADLHLHGGISIDLDYPIHRYFLWAKQIEFQLGAAAPQLARLGAFLAADPVPA